MWQKEKAWKAGHLKEAVEGAKAMGFKGFNLTIPHKVSVIPMLDELTKAAEVIGAINGLGMLVNQAALNFTLWTGQEAPIEVMTKALEAEFGL